jgi:hypothetical protein
MYLNQFSVRVIGGIEKNNGYVEMRHNLQYSISLRNDRYTNCDAVVTIDGKEVGTWRIPSRSQITIDRPANDSGIFTFFEVGSKKGRKAGLVEGDPKNGLISVRFIPERQYANISWVTTYPDLEPRPLTGNQYYDTNWNTGTFGDTTGTFAEPCSVITCSNSVSDRGSSSTSYSAGGTGLSGQSDQIFGSAPVISRNYAESVTVNLRLVSSKSKVRQLRPISSPIPPPV